MAVRKLSAFVTLRGWSANQTIPLSVLARNQTKGLDSRSPTRPEVGGSDVLEKPEGQLVKEPREWVGEERRREAVENGSRREQSRWVSSPVLDGQQKEAVKDDSQKWVGIPSGFTRSFAKNTLPAIVYKMHEKLYKKCHRTTLFALGAHLSTYCSFVLFLPLPRLYFLWP